MFGDILLGSLGNMPFLNNGAIFPTTSVRGCRLIISCYLMLLLRNGASIVFRHMVEYSVRLGADARARSSGTKVGVVQTR